MSMPWDNAAPSATGPRGAPIQHTRQPIVTGTSCIGIKVRAGGALLLSCGTCLSMSQLRELS